MPNLRKIIINEDIILRIKKALEDAKNNTSAILHEHTSNLGTSTKINFLISEMYKKEISELNSLLEWIEEHTKFIRDN